MNPIKVLVVEDSETGRMLIQSILEEIDNVEVSMISSGKSAVKKIETLLPHLVLLDIMLPDVSGFEILENIQTTMKANHISVVMVSALDDKLNINRAYSLGVTDYITKPIGINKFNERIKKLISEIKLKMLLVLQN